MGEGGGVLAIRREESREGESSWSSRLQLPRLEKSTLNAATIVFVEANTSGVLIFRQLHPFARRYVDITMMLV